MTRRELALRLMRADGAPEERIELTFKMFADCSGEGGQAFLDGEVISEKEEEFVKRMFVHRPLSKLPEN